MKILSTKQTICFPKHFAIVLFLVLVALSLILYSSIAFAIPASSDSEPARLTKCRGVTQYAYNIQEVNGTWEWDYVEISGTVTEVKIKEAMRLEKNADQSFDSADIEIEMTQVEERLAQIAQMSYAQIDAHIENTFGGLSVAQKASLKKLYKCVLALIKQLDLE